MSIKAMNTKQKILVIAPVLIVIVLAITLLPIESYAKAILHWVEGLGNLGYVIFFLIYALFTVLFLPGFILTVGGGAIFGLWTGFIVVSLGSTVGASLAFLIGRFFARDMIEQKVANSERFSAIDRAVGKQGWKIVFLTRLSPIFPFNLINYAYGLTKVPFWHYAFASWIGMMPGTLLYVYVGSLAGTVAKATMADQPETGSMEMVFQVVGLIATLAVTFYVTRIARKALRNEVPEAAADEANET